MSKAKQKSGKHPGGRPPHVPTDATRQLVQLHSMVGTTQPVIAEILGISHDTLARHYRKELDLARDQANAAVGGALYKKAIGGDTASMIFWLKTRARWRETVDIINSDGSLRPPQDAITDYLRSIHGIPKP